MRIREPAVFVLPGPYLQAPVLCSPIAFAYEAPWLGPFALGTLHVAAVLLTPSLFSSVLPLRPSAIFVFLRKSKKSLNHLLQTLERKDLDHVSSGLRLEHHLFFGEGIDALACRPLRLVDPLDLHQTCVSPFSSSKERS